LIKLGLKGYIAKRITYSAVLVLFVITLNFIIFMLMPGDPTQAFMPPPGAGAPAGQEYQEWVDKLKQLWGLADPLHIRFAKTLKNLLTWDFGKTIIGRKVVAREMMKKIPYTLWLIGSATVLSAVIGIILGVYSAANRGGKTDTSMVLTSLFFYSVPVFWLGMIFIYAFSLQLGWLPPGGARPSEWVGERVPIPFTVSSDPSALSLNLQLVINPSEALNFISGYIHHAILPVTTLVIFTYAGYLLLTRATMLDALTEDYVITARAKGVSERTVLFKHTLKNASLPLITSVALSFGFLLSGAILTETIYNYPGLGRWIWYAILNRDYPVLMPTFYVIGLCVIAANFIADLLYGIIDPRIKYG